MADSTTAKYVFTLPEVGASDDTWGTKLNANWSKLDGLLSATFAPPATPDGSLGGAMTLSGTAPYIRINETDQVDPLGRYRFYAQSGLFHVQHATAAAWAAVNTLMSFDAPLLQVRVGASVAFKSGNYVIGGLPDDSASVAYLSAITGQGLFLRSGLAVGTLASFRDAANAVHASIAVNDDVSGADSTVITRLKGDARYLQSATSPVFTANPTIQNATPRLYFSETDVVKPGGEWRLTLSVDIFYLQRTGTSTDNVITIGPALDDHVAFTRPVHAGDFNIGATPSGAVSSTMISAVTGVMPTIRSGITDAANTNLIGFRDSGNNVVAYIGSLDTTAPSIKTIITRDKGDARYVNLSGGSAAVMTGGLSFANATGATPADMSKHISLYSNTYGFSVTGSSFNFNCNSNASFYFRDYTGVLYGELSPVADGLPTSTTIVTRGKGDARYSLKSSVGSDIAALGVETVGTYAWMQRSNGTGFNWGSTYAGSNFNPGGVDDNGATPPVTTTISGTWRAMCALAAGPNRPSGLFLRIS